MIFRRGVMIVAILAILGCTDVAPKPPLSKSVFLSIAKRCHAQDVSFTGGGGGGGGGSADAVPTIGFADTVTQIGNRRVRVADCIANDIQPYRIDKITIGKRQASDTRTN